MVFHSCDCGLIRGKVLWLALDPVSSRILWVTDNTISKTEAEISLTQPSESNATQQGITALTEVAVKTEDDPVLSSETFFRMYSNPFPTETPTEILTRLYTVV